MRTITVDGCSNCQLHCPQCPVSKQGYENTIGKGYLTIKRFSKLISLYPDAKHVDFDNFGELFLNKDLIELFEYAHNHKIMLSCAGGVNLNTVQDDVLESLVKNRFQYLNISIDGASQETYSQYRQGGDFDTVVKNIKKINEYKKKYQTPYPKMQWQFVVFGHNEHELPEARKMAEELGMSFYPKINWNPDYSPIKDEKFVREQTGWDVVTRDAYMQKHHESYMRPTCYILWEIPRRSWDLTVTGCCWNTWVRVTEDDISRAKEELQGYAFNRSDIFCRGCKVYSRLKESGNWLTTIEIFRHTIRLRIRTLATYYLWLWRA